VRAKEAKVREERFMRRLKILALAALLAGAGATAAEAEGFRLLKLDGALIKWGAPGFGSGATVRYALLDGERTDPSAINCQAMTGLRGLMAANGIDRAAFEERLQSALSMWRDAADIAFVPVVEAAAADIVIGAQATPRGIAYTNVEHAPGPDGRFARLGQATICLNPAQPWRAGGEAPEARSPTYELGRVLTHEIGHAIGLDHPGTRGEVMAFSYQEDLDHLTPGDIEGIQLLYGAPRRRN
jgi:hypothetical protein